MKLFVLDLRAGQRFRDPDSDSAGERDSANDESALDNLFEEALPFHASFRHVLKLAFSLSDRNRGNRTAMVDEEATVADGYVWRCTQCDHEKVVTEGHEPRRGCDTVGCIGDMHMSDELREIVVVTRDQLLARIGEALRNAFPENADRLLAQVERRMPSREGLQAQLEEIAREWELRGAEGADLLRRRSAELAADLVDFSD